MKSKTLVVGFAVASILVLVFVVRRHSSGPAMNLRPSVAVGEVLAEETTRLLGGKGNIIVIGRASAKDGQTAAGEQIASFGAAMRRRGSPRIASTEWLPRPPGPMMNAGELTSDRLLELIEKNPEAEAFVVFAGLPPLSASLGEKINARSLKLLAVCGYGATVRRWLETRALAVAVVPRFGELPPETPAPKTVKDWFRQEFELLTPESIGRLPY
jgi:hypothetical protein